MAKGVVVDVVAELKKLLASNKLVFGSEEALKLLRQGKLERVFLSANCSPIVKSDIESLCKTGNIECVVLTQSNDEIGVICRKPFSISVVGVMA